MEESFQKHRCIVLGSQHYNNVGMCKSLTEAGLDVTYVNCVGDHKFTKRLRRYVKEIYQTNSIEEGIDFIVSHFKNEEYKPFIFTGQDDVSIALNNRYHDLIDNFYFNHCAFPEDPNRFFDKKNMYRLAENLGLNAIPPRYVCVHRGEVTKDIKYPIITKVTCSTAGKWKGDVYICKTEEELVEAWDKIAADEIFVQEYIEKQNELDVQGFSINDGEEVICVYAISYIRCSNKGYGYYMKTFPITDKIVLCDIQRIIKGMKFSGIFCIEYLIDKENKLHFMEVNMRNDSFGYASTYGGFNLPYQWAKATLEGHINLDKESLPNKSFTCMVADVDIKNIIRYQVAAWKWLWQYITVDCLLDRDKKDPWLLCALYRAFKMGIIKMWIKSAFKLYTEKDYTLAF